MPEARHQLPRRIVLIGTGVPTQDMRGIGGAGMTAIKLAEVFAREDRVWVLPWWAERPSIFKKNRIINRVEYIRRDVSLSLVVRIMKTLRSGSLRGTMQYTHGLHKLKYALLYLFDRAHIELLMERLQPSVVHIHGFDLSYLPYIDAALNWGVNVVCTSHGLWSLDPGVRQEFDKAYEAQAIRRLAKSAHAQVTTVST